MIKSEMSCSCQFFYLSVNCTFINWFESAFSALTLLVGQQEGHLA